MSIFYPTIKSLKQKLQIQPINTGKQFTHNGRACGIVFDDIERLNAVMGLNGCVHLKSGTEFSTIQYRGQNEDFGVCKTTIDRLNSREEQFLSICQTIAFEELLESHPFVKYAKNIQFQNNPLCLNLTGIAQHYGLDTNYLDITSNFDVACFFATCKYINGEYYPIGNISKVGIIYSLNELFLPPFVERDNKDVELEYLGWQPLPRPEQQRANILKVKKNINLDTVNGVSKYKFKHSISQSKKIFKQFDGGKVLFPHDSAADLANECKKLNSFTSRQINKALKRFEHWNNKEVAGREEFLNNLNIEVVKKNTLSWGNFIDVKQGYWEEKINQTMNKVNFRMTVSV